MKNNKIIDDSETLFSYQKRKLGNIGEVYFYNVIANRLNHFFTARDLGDGFGFDMYHQDILNNYLHEYLIEVKATSNLSGDDFFTLSNNEFEKMMSCSQPSFSHYYISRVFFDSTRNVIPNYNILEFNPSNGTFCWYDKKDEIMYETQDNGTDNQHRFVRYYPSRTLNRCTYRD